MLTSSQAVVYDEHLSLHISYPRAKMVPTILFTNKKRQPLIIRPRFDSDEQRKTFLDTLKDSSLGKLYDHYRIVQLMISTSLMEMKKFDDAKTDRIVCSHTVHKALATAMPHLAEQVE